MKHPGIPQSLLDKINQRAQQGNIRSLKTSDGLIDFVSNDYLGLSRSKELHQKIQEYSYEGITNLNGSTGSRLLAGNYETTQKLEEKLAGIFNAEAALLFNSGYVANLALISSVPQRGDTILYDSLSHVCLKEGAWLSKAESFSFRHNDPDDLEARLKRAKGEKYVIIESIYSMDGDEAPFREIVDLAHKHNAYLIVDEAHGTGVFGKNGSGKVCELGLENDFFTRVYTFGKAMGVHGACIAGSKELIEYLINFARPFIYTSALPIHSVFSIDAAFEYLSENPQLQKDLSKRIQFFNDYFSEKIGNDLSVKPESHSAIQPVIVPGNEKVKAVSQELQNSGFDVRPILSPTVKEGTERLRISLHTHNSEKEIKDLIDLLSSHL